MDLKDTNFNEKIFFLNNKILEKGHIELMFSFSLSCRC